MLSTDELLLSASDQYHYSDGFFFTAVSRPCTSSAAGTLCYMDEESARSSNLAEGQHAAHCVWQVMCWRKVVKLGCAVRTSLTRVFFAGAKDRGFV